MAMKFLTAPALKLQDDPPVYVAVLPGKWLLQHTTPSWRSKDVLKGFQRIVREDRARQIARTVIDKGRTFPNAITLATNVATLPPQNGYLTFAHSLRFLVVDGQHRLWAQKFAAPNRECQYACIIHLQKTEEEMARLFLEINDNQRKVPSSLRWDLVRLVRPTEDETTVTTADIVYELATRPASPFFISIDLTGEGKDVSIKQGSLAPEIRSLVGRINKKSGASKPTTEDYVSLLIRFFAGVRSLDPDGWGNTRAPYYKARVLRALIRVLADLASNAKRLGSITAVSTNEVLSRIQPETLSEENVKLSQGSAGVTSLYQAMISQIQK